MNDHHEFIERDEEPMRWFRVGGYPRAAYVAYLAARLGRSRAATRDVLTKYGANIVGGIDSQRLTPDAFIDALLDDAEAAVAMSKPAP